MPEKPENDVSDEAREAEARDEALFIRWRGHEFSIERDRDKWSVDFIESLEEGKSAGIVRGAIGDRAWRQVKAAGATRADLTDLTIQIAQKLGFTSAGESETSSD